MKKVQPLRHSRNCTPFPGVKLSSLSNTAPNQTLTIREILDRHRQGIGVQQNQYPPVYNHEFIPDFKKLDLVDIDVIKAQNQQRKVQLEESIRLSNLTTTQDTDELKKVSDFLQVISEEIKLKNKNPEAKS
jgi:hypothetical protein